MTSILLMIVLFPLELATLVWALRRTGLLPFPHGTMLYLFTGQIMLALHAYGVLTYDFLRVYTTYAYIHFFPQMFTLQAIMFFALTATVPQAGRVSIPSALRRLKISDNLFWALIVAFYACWTISFFGLNWDVVWSNSAYLAMTDPERVLRINNALVRLAFSLQGPLSILSAVSLSFAVCTGRRRVAMLLAPIVIWSFIYQLAAHSRAAAAYLILAGLLAALFPRGRVVAGIAFVVGLITMFSVLWGRGSAHHGLSSIPEYFDNVQRYYNTAGLDAVSNIYEGVFTTAEYFSRHYVYNTTYKVLSVLPSLSVLDGYDKIRDVYGIRLFYFVPMPAINEVLYFGAPYAAWYFGVQLVAGRLSADLVVRRPGLVPIGINALLFLGSYLQFAYDARSVFRIFFVVLVACLILRWQSNANAMEQAINDSETINTNVADAYTGVAPSC